MSIVSRIIFALFLLAIVFVAGVQVGIRRGRGLEREEIRTAAPVGFSNDGSEPLACIPWVQYEMLVDGDN